MYLLLRRDCGFIKDSQDVDRQKIDLWGPGELGAFGTKNSPSESGGG